MMRTRTMPTNLGKLVFTATLAVGAACAFGQPAGFRATGTWLVTGSNIGDHVATFMEGAIREGERAEKEIHISRHLIPPGVCGAAGLEGSPAIGRAVRRPGQGGYVVTSAFHTGQPADHAWGSLHFLLTPNAAGDGMQGVGTIKVFATIEDFKGDQPSCTAQATATYVRVSPPR